MRGRKGWLSGGVHLQTSVGVLSCGVTLKHAFLIELVTGPYRKSPADNGVTFTLAEGWLAWEGRGTLPSTPFVTRDTSSNTQRGKHRRDGVSSVLLLWCGDVSCVSSSTFLRCSTTWDYFGPKTPPKKERSFEIGPLTLFPAGHRGVISLPLSLLIYPSILSVGKKRKQKSLCLYCLLRMYCTQSPTHPCGFFTV